MAEDSTTNPPPPPPQSPHQRRSSFAGQTFADLFGPHRSGVQRDGNNSPPAHASGPITQAAADAQRRRLSLTTLGLSGSPGSSPFGSYRGLARRGSIGSDNSGSIDESAIEDEGVRDPNTSSTPVTPFARRVSFGARAMRDIRNSLGGGGGGGAAGQNGTKSPPRASSVANTTVKGTISSRDTHKGRGSADFWSENMRNRAERTSISLPGGPPMTSMHSRAKSVAMMETPIKEMPPAKDKKPDHYQERMLRGELSWD